MKRLSLSQLCTESLTIVEVLLDDEQREMVIDGEPCCIYGPEEAYSTHPATADAPPLYPALTWKNIRLACLRRPADHELRIDDVVVHSTISSASRTTWSDLPPHMEQDLTLLVSGLSALLPVAGHA